MGLPLVRLGWRPPGLSVPLPPFSSSAPQNPEDFSMMAYSNDIGLDPVATPHAYVNRRWGNPAGTQHSPVLRQKAVYMRTLPGLMDCGKAGPFGLVPGMLTHLQGDQVN